MNQAYRYKSITNPISSPWQGEDIPSLAYILNLILLYNSLKNFYRRIVKGTICCIIIIFHAAAVFSQETGAVCISEQGDEPHGSAMLHVSSTKKGVLFPRMNFETATKIENKNDGLLVFITDSLKQGYWYWNAKEAKWIQIRTEGSSSQDVEAPQRGIIMYSGEVSSKLFESDGRGKTGTKMEGWQICNGNNNSPNLTGRFIMGATTRKQEYGGADSIKLTLSNMPSHTHGTNQVTGTLEAHTHIISDQQHTHNITVGWRKVFALWGRKNRIEVRHSGNKVVMNLPESSDVGEMGKIKMLDATGKVTFEISTLNSKIFVKNTGEGKAIENRPNFYVLIYLMRIN